MHKHMYAGSFALSPLYLLILLWFLPCLIIFLFLTDVQDWWNQLISNWSFNEVYMSQPISSFRPYGVVFDGHSENWPKFQASFELTIKKKYSSPEIRMYYLRRYLVEQPKKVIAGYGGDEFDEAWDELKTKYWDKSGYVRKLPFQLANIKKCRDHKDLERFQLEVNKRIRQLTKQGEHFQGDPIYLALERKVPKPILRKIFEKKTSSATWSTNPFCAALKEIVKHENELNAIYANEAIERVCAKRESQLGHREEGRVSQK